MNIIQRHPFTPGEILQEEFMEPHDLSQQKLAKLLRVTRRRVHEIIKGKRAITPDTTLRLGKLFKMSSTYWLNLQMKYDLWQTMEKDSVKTDLENIHPLPLAA